VRCSSCEPLLDAYIESTLHPRQARAVAAHLRLCDACAGFLRELRIVDALLATARRPGVAADFTATVVGATHSARPPKQRRSPLGPALLLYLGLAWALALVAALRARDLSGLGTMLAGRAAHDAAALGAVTHALAPAAPFAAAAVSGVLVLDVLLLAALFYGYRRVRPIIALYLARGPRT